MKRYEEKLKYENDPKGNPFTLSFGNKPYEYISRLEDTDNLIHDIQAVPPLSHCFIITGVRRSGKTVMLTSVSKAFENDNEWIVVDLNPADDLRECLAAKLHTVGRVKKLFLEANFSFSFQGISFSLKGKTPLLNIDDLLDRMLAEIKRQGKKVLVTINEASNNIYMKKFALSFLMLTRAEYPLFIVATGLFENISSLENQENLTFLIRAPKTYLSPLNIGAMASSYESSLRLNQEEALKCAKLTKGYAFAFQLLGYLMFEAGIKSPNTRILSDFDQYLSEYAYSKVWASLTNIERKILSLFKTNGSVAVASLLERGEMTKGYFSRYRDRLIKKGVIASTGTGKLAFALPRFNEFIETQAIDDE